MKCPKCGKEMKYFKDYVKKLDGYQCSCGERTILIAYSLDPRISDEEDMFTQYGWSFLLGK